MKRISLYSALVLCTSACIFSIIWTPMPKNSVGHEQIDVQQVSDMTQREICLQVIEDTKKLVSLPYATDKMTAWIDLRHNPENDAIQYIMVSTFPLDEYQLIFMLNKAGFEHKVTELINNQDGIDRMLTVIPIVEVLYYTPNNELIYTAIKDINSVKFQYPINY